MATIKVPFFAYYRPTKPLVDRALRVKATGGDATGDNNSDESLQAVIEKSKKLLAKQRDLLQQVLFFIFIFYFVT